MADATLQDVLDPVFAYQTGSMKMDNTLLVSTVVCPSGVCDEAAIFTQVDGSGIVLGDGDADADTGSYTAGTRTIDLGDGNNSNNAQLDLSGRPHLGRGLHDSDAVAGRRDSRLPHSAGVPRHPMKDRRPLAYAP